MTRKSGNQKEVFEAMVLRDDACFLCGSLLKGKGTREHVFPRWLIKKHNLEKTRLILLNGTSFQYQKLTIPCCAKCNNEHLSRLESDVRAAFTKGYTAVKKLPALTLYKWIGKIFFGILRKELQLYADLKNRKRGTIIPKKLIEGFSSLHLFLQSIRRPFTFRSGEHFSVLVVNLHSRDTDSGFDFQDSLNRMLVAIRSNDVGIIVALEDAGIAKETYGRYVRKVRGRPLTLIQFSELYAKILYQASLITRTPKFVTAVHEDQARPVEVHMLPIAGLSSVPVIETWNQEHFARVLSVVFEKIFGEETYQKIYVPPDRVMTWMNDQSGKLTFWNADGSVRQ